MSAGVVLAGVVSYIWFPGCIVDTVLAAERLGAGFAVRTIDTSDGAVPFLDGGHGPVVLLLHGFEDSKDNWLPVARRLTDRYRVLIPDLAAHGDNHAATDGDYRPAAQARRMHAFLAALGVPAAHVAGVSMGGEIAGAFAADYPRATLTVAMISAAGTRPDTPTVLAQRILGGDDIFHVTTRADLDRLMQAIGDSGMTLPGILQRVMLQEYHRRNPQWDSIFRQLTEPAQLYLLDSLAPMIRAPALVVWGAHDPIFAVSGGRRLVGRLPRGRFVLLPDCGHLCPVSRPAELADAYRTFLTGAASSPVLPGR